MNVNKQSFKKAHPVLHKIVKQLSANWGGGILETTIKKLKKKIELKSFKILDWRSDFQGSELDLYQKIFLVLRMDRADIVSLDF